MNHLIYSVLNKGHAVNIQGRKYNRDKFVKKNAMKNNT